MVLSKIVLFLVALCVELYMVAARHPPLPADAQRVQRGPESPQGPVSLLHHIPGACLAACGQCWARYVCMASHVSQHGPAHLGVAPRLFWCSVVNAT
jgi:hypothetical protein